MRHHPRHPGRPSHPGHAAHSAAFAEGRRLRETARARRAADPHLPAPVRVVLWMIAVPLIFTVVTTMLALVLAVALTGRFAVVALLPVLLGTAAVLTVRRHQRRAALRRGGSAGTAPLPARPAARPRPDLVWARARDRFHGLRSEYAAYECDTMAVLRLPALADVSVPSTGRFVDAFAEAQALESDALPPAGHAANFVAAVDRAERAWRAAREAAERIRLSGLTPAERGTVERVIKLLTTARDSDSDAECLAAYARARSELAKLDRAGVIHLPRPAQAALAAAAQPALPRESGPSAPRVGASDA